ncbi:MAG TPA: DUF309 domain-containing protein [Thermoanaerobaculia bacterium]
MPIHPILEPGLEAYRRGDYVQALIAWEEPWKALEGDDRQLSLALVRLAGALHHQREGRRDSALHLYDSARQVLAELPEKVLGVDVPRLRKSLPPSVERALASPPRLSPAPRVPRRLVIRFALLVVIVLAGFAAMRWSPLGDLLSKEAIISTLERLRGAWWAPVALIASYVVLCPLGVPPSPLMVAGAVVFGPVFGALYNTAGVFLGTCSMYFVGRLLGRELIVHLLGRRIKRVERAIARQTGFWSLAGIRFLPLPFLLVNYCAALAGIPAGLFFAASLAGFVLTIPIFNYFAWSVANAATGDRSGVYVQIGIAFALLIALTLAPRLWTMYKRRRRYRQLLARRRQRPLRS